MPISKDLLSSAEVLMQLDDNAMWLSPVSSIAQRLSDASFQTPKATQSLLGIDDSTFSANQPLATDSVKFNFDDSSDSVHQFMQNQASGSNSCDTSFDADLDIVGPSESPGRPRALTFGASPSAPALGDGAAGRRPQRLLSVPTGASSPVGRRRQQTAPKRRSPESQEAPSLSPSSASSGPQEAPKSLTPKRRRMERPLADISNSGGGNSGGGRRAGPLLRCMSELSALEPVRLDSAKIDKAIASIDSLNLIGNSEQGHSLPTVKELDYGIRYVTHDTVAKLLAGHLANTTPAFTIVDCRYPYEFHGGHISGAVNIYRREDLLADILAPAQQQQQQQQQQQHKPAIIFHCEFSSQRAPKLASFLRQHDRELNSQNYPNLFFPEVYVLKGGYKCFYEAHKDNCEPRCYTKMVDPAHKDELARFEKLGKAWERQNSRTKHSKLERLAASRLL